MDIRWIDHPSAAVICFFLSIAVLPSAGAAPIDSACILHYNFKSILDSVIADVSGHGLNAKIKGGTGTLVKGEMDSAVQITGEGRAYDLAGEYILLPNIRIDTCREFTINIWVKEEGYSMYGEAYIWFGFDGLAPLSANRIGIHRAAYNKTYDDTMVYFSAGAPKNDIKVRWYSRWPRQFMMYSLVFAGSTLKAYVNGDLAAEKPDTFSASGIDTNYAGLGTHWWGSTVQQIYETSRLVGAFDDLRIYSRALTDQEIKALFRQVPVPEIIPYLPKVTRERQPTLRWHPVAGATGYYIVYCQVPFSMHTYALAAKITDTTFTLGSEWDYGDFWWMIRSDLSETFSNLDHFFITSDTVPFLVRYNGSAVSTQRPKFFWHPVAGAAGYKIEIADSVHFNNAMAFDVTDTSFSPSSDLHNGTWYWRVSCSRNYALFSPVDSVKVDVVSEERNPARNTKPFVRIVTSKQGVIISFADYGRGEGSAAVYSVKGQLVTRLKASDYGQNMIVWDFRDRYGKRVTNGLYLLEIKAGARITKQKIIVTR